MFRWFSTHVLYTVTGISVALALVGALAIAPTERIQGPAQRIVYFHAPVAWCAYLAFAVVFVASILVLVRRSHVADRLATASAEVGVVFTTLTLITGAIWGRPIWGTWWTWDARLTTTLFLWFIYVGYLSIKSSIVDPGRAARFSAAIGIIGFIDVPIIHQSVVWWRTLHPQSITFASGGPAMPPIMLAVLAFSFAAFTLLYASLTVARYRLDAVTSEVRALRLALAA
ncbi:MAG: cytochrome c biogenesis protein CcsA [Chloroflexota bacterium]